MSVSVLEYLRRHATERAEEFAYGERVGDQWRQTSWRVYHQEVRDFARAVIQLGLEEKSCLAILAANRPEWAISCLGAAAARSVPVGIYQTCSPEQVAYILEHSEAPLVVVEDLAQLNKVEAIRGQLTALRYIVVMRGVPSSQVPARDGLFSWQAFCAFAEQIQETTLDQRMAKIAGEDLASLIYTSGTTGRPKAVMLNHSNILETCRIGEGLHDLAVQDRLVSYLPMAHIAEQMMSVHMPVYCGYGVYFLDRPLELLGTLTEIQPTVFFGVPRVWERIHAGLTGKLSQAPTHLRALLSWASSVARRRAENSSRGRRSPALLELQWRLANALILEKIRTKIGFRESRIAACGAAPIAREILDFFAGLGVLIYEVYGLSETSGPGTWNHAGHTRLGTVGPVLPKVELRIAEDGEVLFRGPNVFQGYFKSPAATAEAIDADGFFHSGDLGQVDAEGFLTITGRKKEILITSGGKNIAPAGIENQLKQVELIGDVVAVGDSQRFIGVLVTLEEEAAQDFASKHDLSGPLHSSPEIKEAVAKGIRQANRGLARVEAVRNFRILECRFSPETGELTPTLKVKRRVVHARFAAEIAAIYQEGQMIAPEG